MARRMRPEPRRAEIIATTRGLILERGFRSLTLREVARRCGLSAPGLMHHFPTMASLLEAVIDSRDDEDFATLAIPADATLDEIMRGAYAYYAAHPDTPLFDALEAEAVDRTHPAHDHFALRSGRVSSLIAPQLAREFEYPERVAVLLDVVLDGLRLRRMRGQADFDLVAGWDEVRDAVYAASPLRRPKPGE